MGDIPHNAMHSSRKVNLVLVVHGNTNEEFCLAKRVAVVLSKLVSAVNKVVWITGHGSVPHMREFNVISARQEAVQDGRNFALQYQLAVNKADLLLCRLCLSCTTSNLFSVWCWPIVVQLLVVQVVCEC